jgi:Arc/MetJ family transcription regulator
MLVLPDAEINPQNASTEDSYYVIHIKLICIHIRGFGMRTNIDIDDRLIAQVMRWCGARTKKAAVEAGLRLLAQTHAQGSIRRLRGKIEWEGDLTQSRMGKS